MGDESVDLGDAVADSLGIGDELIALHGERATQRLGVVALREQGGYGGDGEPDVTQLTDQRRVTHLRGCVEPVTGEVVDGGRTQDAVGVVVAQHPHRQPGEGGELPDADQSRLGHDTIVGPDTVSGSIGR